MTRPKVSNDEIARRLQSGESAAKIAQSFGLTSAAIYSRIKSYPDDLGRLSQTRQFSKRRSLTTIERDNDRTAVRGVERDPCFRCGVRADVGCRHHAAEAV